MRSNVITIMHKEFARFFFDRRLMVSTLILPGLLIFIVYSIIGYSALSMQSASPGDRDFSIYAVNTPPSIEAASKGYDIELRGGPVDAESVKQSIFNKEFDALIIFPQNFDALVEEYDPLSGKPAPNIEIYYNSSSTTSDAAYGLITDMLNSYKYNISNKFDINRGDGGWNLISEDYRTGSVVASVLPMLLLLMMYSGCVAIAPESIAGEKERGAIAALLVTPVKRSELAAGKILSLGVMALLCGLSTTLGILLALSNVLSKANAGINVNIYGASDYLALLLVILSTVTFNVALISIISAYAKSVKETATMSLPLMFINLLVGVSAMTGGGPGDGFRYYLIPLYNSVQCMKGIFTFDFNGTDILLTVAANIAYSCAAGIVLAKMFASERVIFNK